MKTEHAVYTAPFPAAHVTGAQIFTGSIKDARAGRGRHFNEGVSTSVLGGGRNLC